MGQIIYPEGTSLLVPGDVRINGGLYVDDPTIDDTMLSPAADLDPTKLGAQIEEVYSQESATDAVVERKVMFRARVDCTLIRFSAGSVSIASGGGNAVVDLLKNGSTILTAPITLDSSNTAFIVEAAAGYTSTAITAGDVLEFKLTSASATKPKGVFAQLVIRRGADTGS